MKLLIRLYYFIYYTYHAVSIKKIRLYAERGRRSARIYNQEKDYGEMTFYDVFFWVFSCMQFSRREKSCLPTGNALKVRRLMLMKERLVR